MNRIRGATATAFAVLGLAAGTAFVTATGASAAEPTGPGASAVEAPAGMLADGKVHAYDLPNKGGAHCAWVGHDGSWNGCDENPGVSMLNRASSLYNSGNPGGRDDVNFYYNKQPPEEPASAWACLGNGDAWPNLASPARHFTHGAGRPGYMKPINNNIASHHWVQSCG